MHKFGWLPDGENEERYEYPNIWAREKTTGPDRLTIAPRSNHINLLQKLADTLPGPYLLLYVLVVSRIGPKPGRYQSDFELKKNELHDFLAEYGNYLENDGRHHLWIFSRDNGLLVYDKHNVIYGYGPLDALAKVAEAEGLMPADTVKFPVPHLHHYNPVFDRDEERILQSRLWIVSPLREDDE